MSIKTRFVATVLVAASILAGTASSATPERRPLRRGAVEESQTFLSGIVEWLRDLAARRLDPVQGETGKPVELKDTAALDPNGHK